MNKINQVWGKYELKKDDAWRFSGGLVAVSIKRITNGWMVSQELLSPKSGSLAFERLSAFKPNGSETIYQTGRSEILHLLPSLPVKPVVLRNNKTIRIMSKQSVKLYLAIPINVQLLYGQPDQEHVITEMALESLSNTWFGETDGGEAAFSVGQRVAMNPDDLKLTNFEAICPVKITNTSNHLLELERLIIRVENMALYLKNDQLIASKVNIEFKGPEQISNLAFSTDNKIHGENPVLVAKSRNSGTKSILGKSFHFIKHFTQ
ncbi:MAG TPA: DUF432 domain-containing protein [Sunxiuqinia sp.]|nr:DUF432 domain-containing protein [Sunxiuqinia sp.]